MQKIVAFAVIVAIMLFLAVENSLAHCGKIHDQPAMVVAQLQENTITFNNRAVDIAIQEQRCEKASQELGQMINELKNPIEQEVTGGEAKALELHSGAEVMKSENFRIENGRMDWIAPSQP